TIQAAAAELVAKAPDVLVVNGASPLAETRLSQDREREGGAYRCNGDLGQDGLADRGVAQEEIPGPADQGLVHWPGRRNRLPLCRGHQRSPSGGGAVRGRHRDGVEKS